MSDYSMVLPGVPTRTRSMGLKLLVICALALSMTVPGFFVSGVVDERMARAKEVKAQISGFTGGPQTFLGPALAIPYKNPIDAPQNGAGSDTYLVFPDDASASVNTVTEERRRSLFETPVYQANLKFDAAFDLAGLGENTPEGLTLDWSRAEIVVGVSDARGALADATLTRDGITATLAPAEVMPSFVVDGGGTTTRLTLLGSKAREFAKPGARFQVSSSLRFSGAQRIGVLCYGKTTRLSAQGDWPNPGFDGGFLPVRRSVSGQGFNAEWSVPFIARGVRAQAPASSIHGLDASRLGISFIELADPYQSVSRSLKYLLLFVGLVFLSYFTFEVTSGKRAHPAQYVLVGIAQTVFYLLLLSLAERVGFDWGFLAAGSATVLLLAVNAAWVFASRLQGFRALGVFSLLYGLIYYLLRAEDSALLVGAIASFLAVAAVMYLTRKIDWYSPAGNARPTEASGPATLNLD